MEKLRQDDYVLLHWQAGEGNFAWLVERNGNLFLYTVIAMKQLSCRYWAFDGRYTQVDVVRNVFNSLGFLEFPVYADYRKAVDKIQPLLNDIKCYEATIAQIQKEFAEKSKSENSDIPK